MSARAAGPSFCLRSSIARAKRRPRSSGAISTAALMCWTARARSPSLSALSASIRRARWWTSADGFAATSGSRRALAARCRRSSRSISARSHVAAAAVSPPAAIASRSAARACSRSVRADVSVATRLCTSAIWSGRDMRSPAAAQRIARRSRQISFASGGLIFCTSSNRSLSVAVQRPVRMRPRSRAASPAVPVPRPSSAASASPQRSSSSQASTSSRRGSPSEASAAAAALKSARAWSNSFAAMYERPRATSRSARGSDFSIAADHSSAAVT